MQIEICPIKDAHFMVLADPTITVCQLKERISLVNGSNPRDITCVHHGEIMEDEKLIKAYHIHRKSKIYISTKHSSKKKQKVYIPAPTSEQLTQSFGGMSVSEYLEVLKKRNPKIAHMINDEDTVLELMSTITDPEVNFEKMKMTDRILNKDEMIAGGIMELYHNTLTLEELYESTQEPAYIKETIIPDKPKEPSTEALPIITPFESKLLLLESLISRNPADSSGRKIAEVLLDFFKKCFKEEDKIHEGHVDTETESFNDGAFFFGENSKSKPFRQVFHTPSGDRTFENASKRSTPKPKTPDESDDMDLGVD